MHQQSSVAHQSLRPWFIQLALQQWAGGQHWAAALRRLSCLSSLLGGAGESDQLARPGEGPSAAGQRCGRKVPSVLHLDALQGDGASDVVLDGSDGFRYVAQSGGYSTHAQK